MDFGGRRQGTASRARGRRAAVLTTVTVAVCGLVPAAAGAATPLAAGHLLVSDYLGFADGAGGMLDVDPATGATATVSANGDPAGGAAFGGPVAVALEADGDIVTVQQFAKNLVRIDPVAGTRTLVSGPGRGSGPAFDSPNGIAVAPDGSFYVADFSAFDGDGGVFRVDPVTGDRTEVSSNARGAGPSYSTPSSIAIEPDGSLIVVDTFADATVLKVDPATGDREALMSAGDGGTPAALAYPFGLALEADGSVLVADGGDRRTLPGIIRIDPVTKARSVVSSSTVGSGEALAAPLSLAVAPGGTIYAGQGGPSWPGGGPSTEDGNVIAIDPGTGDRALVAATGITDTYGLLVSPAFAAPAFTSADHATFAGGSGSFTVRTSAGLPAATAIRAGALPPGVTLTDRHDGTATLSAAGAAPGVHAIDLTAANHVRSAGQRFVLTVTAPPALAPPAPGPPAPAACRSDRVLSVGVTLAAPRGIHLRRTVIRVNGKVKRILGRGVTRFTLSLTGYPPGVTVVLLKSTTTRGRTYVGTRTYRVCGYAARPPKRLTPLHAARG